MQDNEAKRQKVVNQKLEDGISNKGKPFLKTLKSEKVWFLA